MSHFIFSIESFSTKNTDLEILSKDFDLSIHQPKLFKKLSKADNYIEFILTDFSFLLNQIAHKTAHEINFNLKKVQLKIHGKVNPELLLSNAYIEKSHSQKISIELTPFADASAEELDLWLRKINNNFLFHQKLQQLKPLIILKNKQAKILLKAG